MYQKDRVFSVALSDKLNCRLDRLKTLRPGEKRGHACPDYPVQAWHFTTGDVSGLA